MDKRRWLDSGLVLLVGSGATGGQILFIREVFVLSHGMELTIGLVMGIHLFFTALGSWVAGTWMMHPAKAVKWAHRLAFVSSVLLPLTILALSLVRNWLGVLPTEYVPLPTLLVAAAALQAPFCVAVGMFFPVALSILRTAGGGPNVTGTYVTESLGSGVAGILVALVLAPRLWPLQIACLLGCGLALGGLLLRWTRNVRWTDSLLLATMLVLGFGAASPSLQENARRAVWQKLDFDTGKNTPLGFLEAVSVNGSTSIYQNGILLGTQEDPLHAIRMVGVGELQETVPGRVLLIGGGQRGYLDVLFARAGRHVHYVEPNPFLLDFAGTHLGLDLTTRLPGQDLTLSRGQERMVLENAADTYDLVLVDGATPTTLTGNRLTTVEFFRLIRRVLSPGGLLVFDVQTSAQLLLPGETELLALLYWTLKAVFDDVVVIPGVPSILIAGHSKALDPLRRTYLSALGGPDFDRIFPAAEHPDPVGFFDAVLRRMDRRDYRINTDDFPSAYHQAVRGQMGADYPGWIAALAQTQGLPTVLLALPVLCMLLFLLVPSTHRTPHLWGRVAAVAAGFTGMSTQLLILTGFQVRLGSLYEEAGVLITVFMLGLAGGAAWEGTRKDGTHWRRWMAILILWALLPMAIRWAADIPWTVGIVFHLLSLAAGILTGAMFILLVRVIHPAGSSCDPTALVKNAGRVYSLDLVGAGLGAALLSPLLFPVLGMRGTCSWLVLSNAAVAAMFLMARGKTTVLR
jgi:spermidine synthase